MRKSGLLTILVCLLAAANVIFADTVRGIDIEFVTVGNAGNPGDTIVVSDGSTGHGAVNYDYRISRYEITNAQWNAFTAAAGVPTGNPGYAYALSAYFTGSQQPTNEVSWYEAAQFCNYLTSGDKSKGAYRFSGDNIDPGSFQGIDRASSISTYGTTYVIPTEDEWYKAAYYKPDGNGYSIYANGTDIAPVMGVDTKYYDIEGQPWNVGSGTMEQNGTFDMMGNVWEWNETQYLSPYYYGIRGGAYGTVDLVFVSSYRYYAIPSDESLVLGFRIAVIPEPASLLLLGLGVLMMRRKK